MKSNSFLNLVSLKKLINSNVTNSINIDKVIKKNDQSIP